MRILVVEDEPDYDLVILDVLLPRINGLELCRQRGSTFVISLPAA